MNKVAEEGMYIPNINPVDYPSARIFNNLSPSSTKTASQTPTTTKSLTPTPTKTPTPTGTTTPTSSKTLTATPTSSTTNTRTATNTPTPSNTASSTFTPTGTATSTKTDSPTRTSQPSSSSSLTSSPSLSNSPTPSSTQSSTITQSATSTPTKTKPPAEITTTPSPSLNFISRSRTSSTSPSITPNFGQLSQNTQTPSKTPSQINIMVGDGVKTQDIAVLNNEGEEVASVNIPLEIEQNIPTGTLLTVQSLSEEDVPPASIISNTILQVELIDDSGSAIQFTGGDVELCFSVTDIDESKSCLGFVNDNNEWECQDSCLSRNDEGELCGKTPHFTNFAILLSGTSNSGCANESENIASNYIVILSIVFVVVAILVSLVIIVISEIIHRKKLSSVKKRLDSFSRLSTPFEPEV